MARSSRGCSREWDRNDSCPALVTPDFEVVDASEVDWVGIYAPAGGYLACSAEVSTDGLSWDVAGTIINPVSPAGNFFNPALYGSAGDTLLCRVRLWNSASCPDLYSGVQPILLV